MTERIIPIADGRRGRAAPRPPKGVLPNGLLTDTRSRPLRDLRISVTDRCNFRCTYCMPKEVFDRDYPFLAHSELLSFEEITRLARIFVAHGVEKLRLTGGEPLLRKGLEDLVAMLSALRTPQGKAIDLTLTTNGSILKRKAKLLAEAGLNRVTVSLDALDDAVFRRMNDVDFAVRDVLEGIEAAAAAGLSPVKINMVVKRSVNEQEIIPVARHFKGSGHILRFIEFMDVGSSNGWCMDDVVPSAEVLKRLSEAFDLEPLSANYTGETAERWRYRDGSGEVGVISSVTHAFCGDCTRARLSTDGQLYLCLFASQGIDLRSLLRQQCSDAEISASVASIWGQRDDHYSEMRSENAATREKIEMSYIGG
jgi:cyclic pyranopterin phosphate synthase